jgi:purine-binding chemotaxis protein CheW
MQTIESSPGSAGLPPPPLPEGEADAIGQYVTFFIEGECFAFPLQSVLEIIRVPSTVKVPLAPRSLVGLANLRGSVLPILDLRRILSLPEVPYSEATRVVVTDVGTPVGLIVDRVAQVLNVPNQKIESSASVQSTIKAELLTGVVKDVGGRGLVQLFDVKRCVSVEFASIVSAATQRVAAPAAALAAGDGAPGEEDEADDSTQIVTFLVEGQEYAFPIADVEEIVRVPDEVSRVPRADSHVLGLINLRKRLLPLVSLRRIFGLSEGALGETERILVLNLGGEGAQRESVGVVVDQVREVLRVEADVKDQLPALLSRGGARSRIEWVCRLEDGKRLVSVLSSTALFELEAVQAAVATSKAEEADVREQETGQDDADDDDDNKVVVFHLAEQEFGVLVESVQEIIRVPAEMSRVPKTEKHIEGMVNLRGAVLPVLDLRTRFGLPRAERNDRQRILVLSQAGVCTGFIVDSVTEVLRLQPNVIEAAPRLSREQARIMGRVANLKDRKRMIQILDAAALVSVEASP